MDNLLETYGHLDKKEQVELWYNGYQFGNDTVYNSESIITLFSSEGFVLEPYWLNTAQNALIEKLVTNSGTLLKRNRRVGSR